MNPGVQFERFAPEQPQAFVHCVSTSALKAAADAAALWESRVLPLMNGQSEAVAALARISFCHALNNALDHAQAQHILLAAHITGTRLQMLVADDGIGIFRQIAQALKLFDTRLALLELAKGKFTTAATGHSGIGIYVSSRMMDGLAIQSQGLTFDLKIGAQALKGFVDEVFRVFATAHPEVRLKPINLEPAVARALTLFAPHVQLP